MNCEICNKDNGLKKYDLPFKGLRWIIACEECAEKVDDILRKYQNLCHKEIESILQYRGRTK